MADAKTKGTDRELLEEHLESLVGIPEYSDECAALARLLATPAPSTSTEEALRADPEMAEAHQEVCDAWAFERDQAEALRAENARLRNALEFYADENPNGLPNDGPWGAGSDDFGNRARTALSALSR